MLLEQRLEAIVANTNAGRLPLHEAAAARAPREGIRFLLELRPETVMAKTVDGSLAVHCAMMRKELSLNVVGCLVEQAGPRVSSRERFLRVSPFARCDYQS